VFGAPIADGRANQNAVVASREIIARVDELNAEGKITPTRIGIDSTPARRLPVTWVTPA
jgi:hypothetical protein